MGCLTHRTRFCMVIIHMIYKHFINQKLFRTLVPRSGGGGALHEKGRRLFHENPGRGCEKSRSDGIIQNEGVLKRMLSCEVCLSLPSPQPLSHWERGLSAEMQTAPRTMSLTDPPVFLGSSLSQRVRSDVYFSSHLTLSMTLRGSP